MIQNNREKEHRQNNKDFLEKFDLKQKDNLIY